MNVKCIVDMRFKNKYFTEEHLYLNFEMYIFQKVQFIKVLVNRIIIFLLRINLKKTLIIQNPYFLLLYCFF